MSGKRHMDSLMRRFLKRWGQDVFGLSLIGQSSFRFLLSNGYNLRTTLKYF